MRRLTLAIVTTVLLLAGCTSGSDSEGAIPSDGAASSDGSSGSSDADDPAPSESTTPDVPTGPDCDAVWKAGAVLPADYGTCVSDGEAGVQDVTPCKDGTSLVVYLDSFYAVTGQKIVEPEVAPLQDTDEFGATYSACTGE
jgi:hypothetical protein